MNVAVISHKGGSGKSAIAANLAGALALDGTDVLAVDVDPQAGLTAALGVEPRKPTLYEVLHRRALAADAVCATAIPGLALIPSDLDLAGAELELPSLGRWDDLLRRALARVVAAHGVTILDTPPGLGVLSFAALQAADAAVVACPPDFMSFRAVPHVLRTAHRAGVDVLGIVPTMSHRTTRHAAEVLDRLAADYPQLLLPAIPRRVAVQEAALAGRPLADYAPSSDAARAFADLAQEVLRRANASSHSRTAHSVAR
jgi:chromosome partitioning protein